MPQKPRDAEKFISENIYEILQCCDGTRFINSAKDSEHRRKLKQAFYFYLSPKNGLAGAKKKNMKAEMEKLDTAIMNWLSANTKNYSKFELITKLEYSENCNKTPRNYDPKPLKCNCTSPCLSGDASNCVLAQDYYECRSCRHKDCENQESELPLNFENQLEVRFISKEKGFGLFAKKKIPQFVMFGEVTGVVINKEEADRKTIEGTNKYLFGFHGDDNIEAHSIDPENKGNYARFMNHSHAPNAAFEMWDSRKGWILKIRALDEIKKGEEITIDYDWNDDKMACYCEAENCPKFFVPISTAARNKKPQSDKASRTVLPKKRIPKK